MTLNDLILIVVVILSLFGGVYMLRQFANWIGKALAEVYIEKMKHEIQQKIESYKMKLKKSEFLFQKEFEATSQFISVRSRLLPRYWPDMDWEDACEQFARKLPEVERELEHYIETHGAALRRQPLDRLSALIDDAVEWKFSISEVDVPLEAAKAASKIMEELKQVEDELLGAVWSQSTT